MYGAGIALMVWRLSMGWRPGFQSHAEAKNYSSTKPYRQALELTQCVIQWISWSFLGGGVKCLGCDVDCSPPSSAKSKNE